MTEEWTAPDVERPDPDRIADERTALEQWLDYHRLTLLWNSLASTRRTENTQRRLSGGNSSSR